VQVSVAIENARLFQALQQQLSERTRAEHELIEAYDTTIEGWSHALDLRDKETEGHSQRVTEMTIKLAEKFNLTDEQLRYIRWGALLHDIGKMGVPDGILLKPDQLSKEEWLRMKQHPIFAYEMLSQIQYLQPAIQIPYCHHEKWDGTGYPRGLQGEEIPLAARIFAVVDVWDALTNDRPYRPAWTKDEAIQYIKEQSRIHFDPGVVNYFLTMLDDLI
jgi:putative nucleotidyltransferase with HDIG domain